MRLSHTDDREQSARSKMDAVRETPPESSTLFGRQNDVYFGRVVYREREGGVIRKNLIARRNVLNAWVNFGCKS
jgi:hypothetical protein